MAVLGLSAGMEERARSLHQRALIFDACFSTPGFFKDEDAEIQAFLDGGIGRYSKGALGDEERARGLFLSCVCMPEGDVVISLLGPSGSRFPQWMGKR
jgi:hypothetical protein